MNAYSALIGDNKEKGRMNNTIFENISMSMCLSCKINIYLIFFF